MEIPSFTKLIEQAIIDHWELDALTDFKGATLQNYTFYSKTLDLIKVIKWLFVDVIVRIGQ